MSTNTRNARSVGRYAIRASFSRQLSARSPPRLDVRRALLVGARDGDGDVMHVLAFFGEEARVSTPSVEQLDQPPRDLTDHRRDAPRAVDRLRVPSKLSTPWEPELVELPGAALVVVDVSPHGRFLVTDDDSDLERLGEARRAHPSTLVHRLADRTRYQSTHKRARASRLCTRGRRRRSDARRHRPLVRGRRERADDWSCPFTAPGGNRRRDKRGPSTRRRAPRAPARTDRGEPSPAPDGDNRPLLPASSRPRRPPSRRSLARSRTIGTRGRSAMWDYPRSASGRSSRPARLVPVAAVQNHYSLNERGWDDVVDHCTREEITFVPFFPLRGAAARRSPRSPNGTAPRRLRSP